MKIKKRPVLLFLVLLLGMELFSYFCLSICGISYDTDNQLIKIIFDALYIFVIYKYVYKEELKKDSKDYIKRIKMIFPLSIICYIIGLFLMNTSSNLIAYFFSEANASNEAGVRTLIDKFPIYMIFSVVIYAPFVEEIIFRKSIFDIFRNIKNKKLKAYLSVIVSGFIFALVHVLGTSSSIYDYIYIIPYLCLGISLGLIYYKTNNIWSTIVIHSIHNTMALILYFKASGVL